MSGNLREFPVGNCKKLVGNSWDGTAEHHKPHSVTPEQIAELDRRIKAYRFDRNRGRTAVDALADVRRRL